MSSGTGNRARVPIAASILLLSALYAGPLRCTPPAVRSVPELRVFFQQNCATCHGPDGSAVSPEGRRLKGLDFTSPRALKGGTDPEFARTIRKGIFFGLTMPSFRDRLSEEDAQLMVREVLRKAEKGKPIDAKDEAPLTGSAQPLKRR